MVARFDREWVEGKWTRRAMVSGLTLLVLDEMMARYASYEYLAEIIRHRFESPKADSWLPRDEVRLGRGRIADRDVRLAPISLI